MAEERLIDEDKDRKYKIRKNADGEDELYINETPEEVDEEPVFAYPVFSEEGDEEAAYLTPEQLAERERLKEEEARIRAEKADTLLADARRKIAEGDFEGALYAARRAEELDPKNGLAHGAILRATMRDFTSFASLEEGAAAAEKVKRYSDELTKQEIKNLSSPLEARLSRVQEKTQKLSEENERAKETRRVVFLENRRTSAKAFGATGAVFLVLFIASIILSTFMFADEGGAFLISTIAVAAVTLIAFAAMLITARIFWRAQRNVKLNERDASTQVGRNYLESKKELELLQTIKSAYEL